MMALDEATDHGDATAAQAVDGHAGEVHHRYEGTNIGFEYLELH